jgi:hypothetical protein
MMMMMVLIDDDITSSQRHRHHQYCIAHRSNPHILSGNFNCSQEHQPTIILLSEIHHSSLLLMSSPSSSSPEDTAGGLSGLLTLVGIVPARARFIGGAVASSLLSSLTFGLSFGMVGAAFLPTGPLIPFLMGSWAGHTFGLYHHYRSGKNEAMKVARNFPSLLAHAMWTEFGVIVPPSVLAATEERCRQHGGQVDSQIANTAAEEKGTMMDEWIDDKGYKMVGFAILSLPQRIEDVQDIQRRERERLIQAHAEKLGTADD